MNMFVKQARSQVVRQCKLVMHLVYTRVFSFHRVNYVSRVIVCHVVSVDLSM
jgi:hypothetical protein